MTVRIGLLSLSIIGLILGILLLPLAFVTLVLSIKLMAEEYRSLYGVLIGLVFMATSMACIWLALSIIFWFPQFLQILGTL
ncbi:hypothetical protein [Lactobacillus phage Lbab1]|nr:hypothetical protein [Lactobacillus phage Lbab1]